MRPYYAVRDRQGRGGRSSAGDSQGSRTRQGTKKSGRSRLFVHEFRRKAGRAPKTFCSSTDGAPGIADRSAIGAAILSAQTMILDIENQLMGTRASEPVRNMRTSTLHVAGTVPGAAQAAYH